MSGEILFGVRQGRLSQAEIRRREKVAGWHGCTFVYVNLPGEGYRSWFTGRNQGEPFNGNLAARVSKALETTAPVRYAAVGSARGACGHEHHTPGAAQRCADRDGQGVARRYPRSGGTVSYSDRVVVRTDGERLSEAEIQACADARGDE